MVRTDDLTLLVWVAEDVASCTTCIAVASVVAVHHLANSTTAELRVRATGALLNLDLAVDGSKSWYLDLWVLGKIQGESNLWSDDADGKLWSCGSEASDTGDDGEELHFD